MLPSARWPTTAAWWPGLARRACASTPRASARRARRPTCCARPRCTPIPINRALSAANSCLYGVVHAAIVAAGYSPALGFIHTGKMLSFVYDVGDLYKAEVTVPVAFRAVAAGGQELERTVSRACRVAFTAERLLQRVI